MKKHGLEVRIAHLSEQLERSERRIRELEEAVRLKGEACREAQDAVGRLRTQLEAADKLLHASRHNGFVTYDPQWAVQPKDDA